MIEPRSRSVQIRRTFEAPIELVYSTFAESRHVTKWMKCDETATLDVENWIPEVGSAFKTYMAQEGAFEATSTGRFTEVDPPTLLAFSYDANPELGVPEMHVRVELRDVDGHTEVTLTQSGIPNEMICGVIEGGWTASMRQLESMLAGQVGAS